MGKVEWNEFENLQWKDDPSPLSMLKDGESVSIGDWNLRVDRMENDSGLDELAKQLRSNLTEKERQLLDIRQGLGEGTDGAKVQNRQEKDLYPFGWSIKYIGDGMPAPFHMGGRAKSKDEAKKFAEHAIVSAMMVKSSLEKVP